MKLKFMTKKEARKPRTTSVWTPDKEQLLRQLWPRHHRDEVARLMNLSIGAVSTKAKLLKLKKDTDFRGLWTDEKLNKLRELYPVTVNHKIAQILGTSKAAINTLASKLKLKKAPDFYEALKQKGPNRGAFKSNHTPWNKGKKGIQIGGEATQFRHGHLPHNTKQDGIVTLRFDSDGRPWLAYRIASKKWIPLAHHVFRQFYGEVPKGMVIRHINGNRLDCRLENLECISKRMHRIKNSASVNLTDEFVVGTFIPKSVKGEEREKLKSIYAQHLELIKAKRNLINLKRAINNEQ